MLESKLQLAAKLNSANLHSIATRIPVPIYNRKMCGTAILHIGVGEMHCSHQQVYLDRLLSAYGPSIWAVCGVGLIEPADTKIKENLESQDLLYTVMEYANNEIKPYIVGSLVEYLLLSENITEIFEKIINPDTKIITLTISAEQYFYNKEFSSVSLNSAKVKHDLKNPQSPCTAIGCVVEGLRLRMENNAKAKITILSCDDLPQNGKICQAIVISFAKAKNGNKFVEWIENNVTFPGCMVDRITHKTSLASIQCLHDEYFVNDACPVVTEPFIEWVIEDNFASGRPRLEKVGVRFVSDVTPYETMKKYLVDANLLLLSYLGLLAGYEYIYQIGRNVYFQKLLQRYTTEEAIPILPSDLPSSDVDKYTTNLVARFTNTGIKTEVYSVCSRSLEMLPKVLFPVISENLRRKRKTFSCSALCVAAWLRYLSQYVHEERTHKLTVAMDVDNLNRFSKQDFPSASRQNKEFSFSIENLFPIDIRKSGEFMKKVKFFYGSLKQNGAQRTVEALIETRDRLIL